MGCSSDPETPRAEQLLVVLRSAARLQEILASEDVVLVGGSAAAYYAHHRLSVDHDHVVSNLQGRFEAILDALESEGEWVTNRVRPGKIILGSLGDIEAGVRQLIRRTPLECEKVELPSGESLVIPTLGETLRIKAFLALKRNQTRDYLDIAALSDLMGLDRTSDLLGTMDEFYADQHFGGDGVASQVQVQLADPSPADSNVTKQLNSYKGLDSRWHSWSSVREQCMRIAEAMNDGRKAGADGPAVS